MLIPLFFSLPRKVSIVEYNLHYQDEVNSPFLHSGDRCIIDMFYVYLKAMDEEGPLYRRPVPPEGSQKIHFAQQTLGINKFKYFMKIIAERGELREILPNSVGREQGTCIRDMF